MLYRTYGASQEDIFTFKKECKNFGQGLAYKEGSSKEWSVVISFKKILTSMKINSYLSWLHLKLRRDREIHCKRCRYINIKQLNTAMYTNAPFIQIILFFIILKWKLRICKNQIWLFLQSGLWSTRALRGYQNFHIPSKTARCLPSFFVNTVSDLKLNPETLAQS